MFRKHPVPGQNVEPACEYCEHGRRAADPRMILCQKRGVVSPISTAKNFSTTPSSGCPAVSPGCPVSPRRIFAWIDRFLLTHDAFSVTIISVPLE